MIESVDGSTVGAQTTARLEGNTRAPRPAENGKAVRVIGDGRTARRGVAQKVEHPASTTGRSRLGTRS